MFYMTKVQYVRNVCRNIFVTFSEFVQLLSFLEIIG